MNYRLVLYKIIFSLGFTCSSRSPRKNISLFPHSPASPLPNRMENIWLIWKARLIPGKLPDSDTAVWKMAVKNSGLDLKATINICFFLLREIPLVSLYCLMRPIQE